LKEDLQAHLEILPDSQKQIWPELRPVSELGYVLYGGTAIALRLGHRVSIDFDFFSDRELRKGLLARALPFLAASQVVQDQVTSFTVLANNSERSPVKLSFFGGIDFGRVGNPQMTQDGVLQVASLDDLMATKLKTMLQRVEAKDYRDVAAMIDSGVALERGLAAARQLFGSSFQPSESLKAIIAARLIV
jgi:Nucleotidyl transferase AbiEii toxin, Type IV TA system